MKSGALFTALALATTVLVSPAFADSKKPVHDSSKLKPAGKNLLRKDDAIVLQYWIERHRKGEVVSTNSRTPFQSGDQIKFHLTPNCDGFVSIVVSEGANGEKSVLFPQAERGESNHVTKGMEVVVPSDGFFVFDNNPGTETLKVVVSRKEQDPSKFLGDTVPTGADAPTMISMNPDTGGSKDLIPGGVFVACNPEGPAAHTYKPSESKTSTVEKSPIANHGHKDLVPVTRVASRPVNKTEKVSSVHTPPKGLIVHAAQSVDKPGMVTVAANNDTATYVVKVALQHM